MRPLPGIRRDVAALLTAAVAGSAGCSSPGRARIVTPDEARNVQNAWRNFRDRNLTPPNIRLLYDARLSRTGIALSGSLAVNDRPGRGFTAALSDEFGLRIFSASWDGEDLTFDESAASPGAIADEWRRRFRGAISPRSLSLLFVGVPDDAVPDAVAGVGGGFSLFWSGPGIRCDLDSESGLPKRAYFGRSGERVEVALAFESGDVPSSLVIEARGGSRVRLRLVSAERGSS